MNIKAAVHAVRRELFWLKLAVLWYWDCLLHPTTPDLDICQSWAEAFILVGNATLNREDRLVRLTAMQDCHGCQRATWLLVHPDGHCLECYINWGHQQYVAREAGLAGQV
jgi:hypothetical protein